MSETVYSPAPKELIGPTAYLTAAARAFESQRPDRLFNDPWAASLAGHEGEKRFATVEDQGGSIIVRTRFFDEWLLHIANEQGLRQIVLPAAGLDTRAFRLDWPPETRFFELDQPLILDYKEAILKVHQASPRCVRIPVMIDLTLPDWETALLQAGFNPTQPSAWLIEGLLFYLPFEQSHHLFERISRLTASNSWIGFDAIHSEMIRSPRTQARIERLARSGAPWIGAIDDPVALLASLGWEATWVSSGRKGYEYGRAVFPFIPQEGLTPETERLYHMLVTARRK
ncbi:SAM-dependent methyltransferase [Thermogemmatispora carboxidivorans]|uniref:SAM-dependent methyltransferase n=1 Tax=Thermogemmatispora carboxidivorans TaxID=1382306 RepID=UPI00069AF592|nr:SAM-dependent methyltransferase [Thermogemmatispora carboxidivorans]